jgi:protein-tyrosine phosphatase
MVDIHCHILPEVDDGARSWDESAEMCRIAFADGIRHIVATPHANSTYDYDRSRHEFTLDRLRQVAPDGLTFSLGCDFHMSYENVQDLLVHPARYTISGTNYLLVEFSDYSIPHNMGATLEMLMNSVRPIITHPERNPILQRNPGLVLDWVQGGAIVQVTASSLTGFWGRSARKAARWLLDRDAVHILASDAHDTRHRPPVLSEARDTLAKKDLELARALSWLNPQAVVEGKTLPYYPRPLPV